MELTKMLIMENLPTNGSYLNLAELRDNVRLDSFSMKNLFENDIFELALNELVKDQFVFINGRKEIAATQYGISRLG